MIGLRGHTLALISLHLLQEVAESLLVDVVRVQVIRHLTHQLIVDHRRTNIQHTPRIERLPDRSVPCQATLLDVCPVDGVYVGIAYTHGMASMTGGERGDVDTWRYGLSLTNIRNARR